MRDLILSEKFVIISDIPRNDIHLPMPTSSCIEDPRPRQSRSFVGTGQNIIQIIMKQNIHPKYYPKASVRCACGNTFNVGSAKEFIETEVCAQCHPFYTKQEKVMDTLGRVQKFKERLAKKGPEKKKKIKTSKNKK